MKIRKSYRIPLGFLVGFLYTWRADPSTVSFLIGAALMVLGECIRFVSSGTLIKFEGVINNGIYAYTRNPLYIGSFFIGMGACIMGRDMIFTMLFLILYLLIYARVIRREESYLINRYGDEYLHYLHKVPRILPRRFKLREVLGETEPFLAVKNREHLTIVGTAVVWAIMAFKMIF